MRCFPRPAGSSRFGGIALSGAWHPDSGAGALIDPPTGGHTPPIQDLGCEESQRGFKYIEDLRLDRYPVSSSLSGLRVSDERTLGVKVGTMLSANWRLQQNVNRLSWNLGPKKKNDSCDPHGDRHCEIQKGSQN